MTMQGAGLGVGVTRISMLVVVASVLGRAVEVRVVAEETAETRSERGSGWFTLDRLEPFLEFQSDYYDTRVRTRTERSSTKRTQINRNWGLEERFGFEMSGAVVGPRVLTYQGQISFALTQDHYHERHPGLTQSDSDSGYLLQYDLRANLFPGERVSGSVYGLRNDDRINRQFQPTLDRRRTGFGTSWTFSDDRFPMELTYDYLETDRTGNRDGRDDEHFTDSVLHYGASWIISEYQKLRLDFEHAEMKQEYQGLREAFDTTRDLFTLEHDLSFGPDDKHSLRTIVHWQEESGDFARDFLRIGPQLTLHHSDTLQTSYEYQVNLEQYEGYDVESHRASFQLVHQVYSNLTTTLDLFGLAEDLGDDVDTTQYGGTIDWQYNRRNDWGHFYANLALAYDTQEQGGDDGIRAVLDESGALRDPIGITLRNRNVISSSLVVTDATNRRVYRLGTDYFAYRRGDVTRIARISTGRIVNGETVLVDYLYSTPTDGQIDTIRVDFSLEQRFTSGFTPYYRLGYRNQEVNVSSGFVPTADRTDHHRMGVRYDRDRFSLGAEYEIFDDTVEPFDAFHVDAVWHVVQSPGQNLNASGRLSRFFFEGGFDRRNVTVIDLSLDHDWRIRGGLSATHRVGFRWEDDSVAGYTRAWEASAGLDYVIGDLTAEVTLEYDHLEVPGSREDDFGVFFRIRRELGNVLARW